MRTFKIVNANGEMYDLTVKNRSFMHTVSGLGYGREAEFYRIGERFATLSNYLAQQEVRGNVYFGGANNISDYFTFAKFCENTPLKLLYDPGTGKTYTRDGFIKTMERSDGENVRGAWVTFICTTPWYDTVNEFYTGIIDGGKKYNYTYSYKYAKYIANTVIIESDSYLPSPMKLVIYGPVVNPIWRHYANNKLIETGSCTVTIPANHKLVIDTTSIPYSIKEYDLANVLIADRYQTSDWNTERFFRLKYGINTITVSATGSTNISLGVEAQIEYGTV